MFYQVLIDPQYLDGIDLTESKLSFRIFQDLKIFINDPHHLNRKERGMGEVYARGVVTGGWVKLYNVTTGVLAGDACFFTLSAGFASLEPTTGVRWVAR